MQREFQFSTHTVQPAAASAGHGYRHPNWLAAPDSFAAAEIDGEGFVIHLATPRFIARYYSGDEPMTPTDTISGITWSDPDVNLNLCELVFLDDAPEHIDMRPFFREATTFLAYHLGRATVAIEEANQ